MIKKTVQPYCKFNPEPKRPGYMPVLKPSFFGTASKRDYDYKSLSFDGINDYVDAGNGTSLNPTDAITIGAWVKPASTNILATAGRARIVNKFDQDGYKGYVFDIADDSDVEGYRVYILNTVLKSPNPITAMRTHVVATYDGLSMVLYENGVQVDSVSLSGSIPAATANLMISRDSASSVYFFNGTIDEVRIYNRALSAAEILQLYNHIDPSRYGLVLEHNYKTGTAIDLSIHGNNGTVYGAVYTS